MEKIYRITHKYDIGNQDVYLKSKTDPSDFAVWVQFLCEENIDLSICPWTEGIAKTLIKFFGCEQVSSDRNAIVLDMYSERSKRCNKGEVDEYNSKFSSFEKQSIIDFIEPFSDYDRDNPEPSLIFREPKATPNPNPLTPTHCK